MPVHGIPEKTRNFLTLMTRGKDKPKTGAGTSGQPGNPGKPKTGPGTSGPPHKPGRTGTSRREKKDIPGNSSFFESTGIFLAKHLDHIFLTTLFLTLVFSILLFDIRFSLAGDDSAYVARAYDFVHHFIFPGFQGPLYPIVLSPFVALFGIRAVPLKAVSLIFILAFVWFFYRAYRNRIPALLLTILLALVSVNSFLLYYASQTFSEAFFLLLQALTFFVFFTFFIDNEGPKSIKNLIPEHLILALCLAGLGLTRAIGFAAFIAVAVYFIFTRQWKNLLLGILSFSLIIGVYLVFKQVVWGSSGMQLGEQARSLIAKDYYNPALGSENIQGFIQRLLANADFYISQSFYTILGIRGISNTIHTYPFLTLFTVLSALAALLITYRKNRYLFFTGIYACMFLFITFLIAHTGWMQSRFIIPYFHLLLMLLLGAAYYLLDIRKRYVLQYLYLGFTLVLFGFSLKITASRVKDVQQITGNYYGLSPDMENYARAGEWVSENLPENTVVACRKPSVSFISSNGRKFFGITRLPFAPVEPFISGWKKQNRSYYLVPMSSLSDKTLNSDLYDAFSAGIVGWGMNKESHLSNIQFLIMDFPDSIRSRALTGMKSMNIRSITEPDSLVAWTRDPKKGISVIYEDSLISLLLRSKVTHVLTDNLRINPDRRNSKIMGTVEQFMFFLDLKYPALRKKVIQMGDDRDEPAVIYELNYKLYGLKIPD